jgi:lipoprotein-anchoring transpeptidase ErfK/SrfK
MISRSLVLLGIGAALLLGIPSVSSAQTATTKTAAVEVQQLKLKAKKPKTTAKANQNKATAAGKGKGKGKQSAKTEEAKANPVGLFSVLFKPNEKARPAPNAKSEPKLSGKNAVKPNEKAKKEILRPVQPLPAVELSALGNEGELRSEQSMPRSGFFGVLFGDEQVMLPQTRALDAALAQKDAGKKFKVKSDFEPQTVAFSGYKPGSIVIDTGSRYLYLVESSSSARRYAIAVGREGLEFKGSAKIGDKQEWPRWIPTKEMQEREPKKYGQYAEGMPGGPDNPLGARAIYLYQGKQDTRIRIHGTNQPQTIGTNSSNGCFRMVNDHVKDLYGRVRLGAEVIVM